jgi:hypothetical protein
MQSTNLRLGIGTLQKGPATNTVMLVADAMFPLQVAQHKMVQTACIPSLATGSGGSVLDMGVSDTNWLMLGLASIKLCKPGQARLTQNDLRHRPCWQATWGLGVTPSSPGQLLKHLKLGDVGSGINATASGQTQCTLATPITILGGHMPLRVRASMYQQNGAGSHSWLYAASGTAGNAIAFTHGDDS